MAELEDAVMADTVEGTNGHVSLDDATATTASKPQPLPPTTISKPIPYTFDLAHLLVHDPSPLPPNPTTTDLDTNARSAAQAIINQLFSTCAFTSSTSGVSISLPGPSFPLPREKPIPQQRAQTTWERFAAKKGILPKRRDERGRMEYDEEKGDWVPKWGYRGKNKEGEGDWLVEVDKEKEGRTGQAGDARKEGREQRKERVRRNERRMRANERRAGKGG